MTDDAIPHARLPLPQELGLAVAVYIEHAYGPDAPPSARRFLPSEQVDAASWLMTEISQRDPASAPLEAVRSFALRIGNSLYPNMKLRLSRPPNDPVFVFSVDCHDACLHARPDAPDYQALEDLKRHNAALADRITAEWDKLGLPTERNYLRRKIRQARLAGQDGDTIIG